ncbi:MAG: iron permease [Frankiales bacterium]|nr:iron permease [Frankiales bacterium]
MTRWLRRALVAIAGALLLLGLNPGAAHAAGSGVSRAAAIKQLEVVRGSIDRTLTLIKEGKADQAFAEAKAGYLSHFEYVEVPLRVANPGLTSDAETKFAEIRGLITSHAPTNQVRDRIVELRRLMDDAERTLTDKGLSAPAVVAGQSFVIIFREGLEAVLLVTVLLGYLESAKATHLRRPIFAGMGLAALASAGTFFLLRSVLSVIPFGREILEAVTALLAVVVLFYVSFWLIARMDQKRWLEFLKAKVWTAVSVGSTSALLLVGFTAVYREGFETALFYQALLSFGDGLGIWVLTGLLIGLAVLAVVAWLIFKLGRRMPIKQFLATAVVLLMSTSIAFLGNAVRSLQEADVIGLHPWNHWPEPPIFVRQSLGYWPSRETIVTQVALLAVYVLGAVYMFVLRPRLDRRTAVSQPRSTAGASV